ncbi:MAG: ABC transporter ATP-binding protein [Simkaniaceae bacterium]|nr:ABC transporter ATP-binding protein [Simkaniaceae bacterium]
MILQAEKIGKRYGKALILRNLSLSVAPGESVAVIGPSGTGKSTLLHILGTLEKPSSGKLLIAGKEVSRFTRMKIRNRHIGFIFQNFNLFEECSVWENAVMPAKIKGESRAKQREAGRHVSALLTRVGLHEQRERAVKHLSGGEKQRVAIARALCNRPALVLADEPSGNLDDETSGTVCRLLTESLKESGGSLIVVTHDPLLAGLCERTYLMKDGRLSAYA